MSNPEQMRGTSLARTALPAGLFILVSVMIEPGSSVAQPAPEWAVNHLASWYEAYNDGDADAMAMLYAPNAVLVPPEGQAHYGRDLIQQQFAGQFADYDYDCTGSNDGWHELGRLAVVWGHDDCKQIVKESGETSTYESHWMATFRNLDGVWLIVYETYAPVNPQSD